MIYHRMFTDWYKCTTLVWDVEAGEGREGAWFRSLYGNSLYFPFNLAVNVKLL